MSYSFSVHGATKMEAIEKVSTEMAKVVQGQPVHSNDERQAQVAAHAFISLLEDDATKDVAVSVNGSISTATTGIRQTSVGVSASLVDKA